MSNAGLQSMFLCTRSEVFTNARIKSYLDPDGKLHPYETMICNRPVFGSGAELSDFSVRIASENAYREAAEEIFNGKGGKGGAYQSAPMTKEEALDASRRRARRKVFDYVICNDFDCFVTLTLSPDQIDRENYGEVIKSLNTYLSNRVARRGLRYVGVPELHKNGGLHFHFVMNSDALRLEDSGTVCVPDHKKPVKVATADRLGIPPEDRKTVYNVTDWELGFSTAIRLYGQRGAVAHYMCKELSKKIQKKTTLSGTVEKIGGRWYLHGGKISKPIVEYVNMNFGACTAPTFTVETDGGIFKVLKFDDNGVVL